MGNKKDPMTRMGTAALPGRLLWMLRITGKNWKGKSDPINYRNATLVGEHQSRLGQENPHEAHATGPMI
jgi:hypothetical protein